MHTTESGASARNVVGSASVFMGASDGHAASAVGRKCVPMVVDGRAKNAVDQRFVYMAEYRISVKRAGVEVYVLMAVNAASVAIVVALKFVATGANGINAKTVGDRRFVCTSASVVSVETVVGVMYVCTVANAVNAKPAVDQPSVCTVANEISVRSVVASIFANMDGGDPTVETAVDRKCVTMAEEKMLLATAVNIVFCVVLGTFNVAVFEIVVTLIICLQMHMF